MSLLPWKLSCLCFFLVASYFFLVHGFVSPVFLWSCCAMLPLYVLHYYAHMYTRIDTYTTTRSVRTALLCGREGKGCTSPHPPPPSSLPSPPCTFFLSPLHSIRPFSTFLFLTLPSFVSLSLHLNAPSPPERGRGT